jgi:hypothetical protein
LPFITVAVILLGAFGTVEIKLGDTVGVALGDGAGDGVGPAVGVEVGVGDAVVVRVGVRVAVGGVARRAVAVDVLVGVDVATAFVVSSRETGLLSSRVFRRGMVVRVWNL